MADVEASVGALIVVLPPDSQWMLPPVPRVRAGNDTEPPPVSPPLHPPTVTLPVSLPVMVEHEMVLEVHETSTFFSSEMDPLVPMHTSPEAAPGSRIPSPESPVTVAVKDSALGLLVAFLL